MLRFCGKCGRRIPEGGGFCPACGAPVRPWTAEDENAWAGRAGGTAPGAGYGTAPGTAPGAGYGTAPGAGYGTAPGTAPGAEYGTAPGTVPAGPSPETPKVVVKTKEDTPEFEHYFNTPGDL